MKLPIVVRRVVGHSMMPTLKPGAIVLGLTWMKPAVGQILIVRDGDKEIIKRLKSSSNDELELVGDNHSDSLDSSKLGTFSSDQVIAVVVFPRSAVSAS